MTLEALGTFIKKERKVRWTQLEIAAFANLNVNTIKKIEAGFIEEVGIKKVDEILDLLGYEIEVRPKGRPATLEELSHEA